jgi:hypothetical protein
MLRGERLHSQGKNSSSFLSFLEGVTTKETVGPTRIRNFSIQERVSKRQRLH